MDRVAIELAEPESDVHPLTEGKGEDDEDAQHNLTLRQHLMIALIPALVPSGVLLLATGIAGAMGGLAPVTRNFFEQVAGGALLITYLKEIFPQVLSMYEEVVDDLGPTMRSTRWVKYRQWLGITGVLVLALAVSTIAQAGAEGFPGVRYKLLETINGTGYPDLTAKKTRSTDAASKFTPGDTVPYFLGFFVDGVCLAYDDNPIALNIKLVKRLALSFVLAIDNLLDGFGLVPVLQDAFGGGWWAIMLAFSMCVLLGAIVTALLRTYVRSHLFHLAWFAFSTLSLLDGALELSPHGLTVYVTVGMVVVWLVLFIGDLCDDDCVQDDAHVESSMAVSVESAMAAVCEREHQHDVDKQRCRSAESAGGEGSTQAAQ